MTHLALSLLGGFQAALDGRPLMRFKSNKVRALLAYLAVEADRPHRREALAAMFWPERSDSEALSNLRYSLASLRKTLGDRTAAIPFLLISHDTIQFNQASDAWLDVTQLYQLVASVYREGSDRLPGQHSTAIPLSATAIQDLQAAIALYRGSFLEGFSVAGAAPFEEWTLLRREQIQQPVIAVLSSLVTEFQTRGNYKQAQAYARQQMALEPWNEAAQRSLMRALALDGQRTAALHQFQTCCRILKEELGVEPAEETLALYEAIREGRWADQETSRQVDKGGRTQRNGEPAMSLGVLVSPCSPVVAREQELAQLDALLAQAMAGAGGVVFVTGEAGSGKTVLLGEFTRRAMLAHAELLVARGACDAVTGIGDPYLPFREILQLLTGDLEPKRAGAGLTPEHARRLWVAMPDAVQTLATEGPDLIDTLVPAAGLALRAEAFARQSGRSDWQARLAQQLRPAGQGGRAVRRSLQLTDIFEQVTHVLQALARQHPLVLALDDLQWADAGSISLLFHLGRRLAASRILLVGAYRPDAVAPPAERQRHPLDLVVHELLRGSGQALIDLDACAGRPLVEALLDSEPNRLGAKFRQQLLEHTEGHPLFTVELLRGMEERGDLVQAADGCWTEGSELHWHTLPTRVEAVIGERIGRLPEQCQALLAAASVEGQEFVAETIASALGADHRTIVHCLSGDLSARHQLVTAASVQRLGTRRLSRYRFRHHLFQQYLYDHLDTVQRAHLHEAVGSALERLHEDAPDEPNGLAPRLAWHFEQAGLADRAAAYHLQAGSRAAQLSAHDEAIAHFKRGSALLESLPDSPERKRLKLELQLAAVSPLMIERGFWGSERLRALESAYEIAQNPVFDDSPERWKAQATVAHVAFWSAEVGRSLQLSQQTLRQAESNQDQQQLLLAHYLVGSSWYLIGDLARARDHLDQALALYHARGHNPLDLVLGIHVGVASLAYQSFVLWLQGYPDQARRMLQGALAAAQEGRHLTTLDFAQVLCGMIHALLARDSDAAWRHLEEPLTLQATGSAVAAWIDAVAGWVLVNRGQDEAGLARIGQGIATAAAVGGNVGYAIQRVFLADSYMLLGQVEAGRGALDEALAWMEANNVHWLEAEAHRLRGELLLGDQPNLAAAERSTRQNIAEACFRRAIHLARQQGARWWELRATTSLCRLLVEQGVEDKTRCAQARQMLAEIYAWFSEGFDLLDLRKAREMLEAA
jgi:DNA-binding SARP family transcriptional activator